MLLFSLIVTRTNAFRTNSSVYRDNKRIYIYRERDIINQLCRKMLKNIFMAQLGFELTTSATPPSTALSVTPTDCAIETTPKKIVRIALI